MAFSGTKGSYREIRWFLFWGAILSGIVLLGTSQTLSFMLTERGSSVAEISCIVIATIPYSWKFTLSPFVKHMILRHKDRTRIIKRLAFASQLLVFVGLASMGFYESGGSLVLLWVTVLITVVSISVHDIVRAYVKLRVCNKEDLGIVTSVENAGFRIGMLMAGACLLYIANAVGWRLSYIAIAVSVLVMSFTTFFSAWLTKLTFVDSNGEEQDEKLSIARYIKACVGFFKTKGVFLLAFIIVSFKFADSCINSLKGVFLHSIGISRLLFANISHIAGVFTMIAGGSLAGVMISRIGSERCIQFTFVLQCLASSIFMFLSCNKVAILPLTLLINTSTFVFGFSNVVFRTFVAEQSGGDVNIDSILLSIGSALRILACSLGGLIAENYSWIAMYTICLISNLPGLMVCQKFHTKNRH
ncbi:MAG: MFS transporter [Holosporales bacterium]|nr:MFS transporter [Holosporales bacterium]